MGIIGRLFGKPKAQPSFPRTRGADPVDANLTETLDRLRAMEQPTVSELIKIYRRLIDIGLFEHGHVDDDRRIALKIAGDLKDDILAGCKDLPDAAAAFEQASAHQIDQAEHYGYGSLHWIMEEAGIGTDKLVEFVVQPHYAELLPNYLAMQSEENLGKIRFSFVKAMIAARREHPDQTDLQVLFELVSKPDPAIGMLMPEAEIAIIRDAPGEYAAAELLTLIYR